MMKFRIGFDKEDRKKLRTYWDDVIDREQWSGNGKYVQLFETLWSQKLGNQVRSVAVSNWSAAAQIVIDFYKLRRKTVLVPSNTFMATPLAFLKGGCDVEFVDCNRHDLCISLDDLRAKADQYKPSAVVVVHIGGHLAFEIDGIVECCRDRGIILIEDCAHAHGASWAGRFGGCFGSCGIYSFYATKTISTGEGAMLVSCYQNLVDFAKKYRDYGKPDYHPQGLNCRMSEFTAALGCVETERLDDIVAWKNRYAEEKLDEKYRDSKLKLPQGMVSGLYKYVVFDKIEPSTGRVYSDPCHHYLKKDYELPNTDWVAENHSCVPIYYKGEEL